MVPYYKVLAAASGVEIHLSEETVTKMEKANEETLKKLDERLEEAEKTEGETEIGDALRERANYLTKIGDMVSILSGMSYAHCRVSQSTMFYHNI